jgi:hypothetical protein
MCLSLIKNIKKRLNCIRDLLGKTHSMPTQREEEEARILELVCGMPGMRGVARNWPAVMQELNQKLVELRVAVQAKTKSEFESQ